MDNNKILFSTNDIELVEDYYDPETVHYTIKKSGSRSSVSFDRTAFENLLKSIYEKDTPGIK